MADLINALEIRKALGPKSWSTPVVWGGDGYLFRSVDGDTRILVSGFYESWFDENAPRTGWIHASISRTSGIPSYEDLTTLHRAVWGEKGCAYQAFVPAAQHINIHPRTLHLWGRADGEHVLPDFGKFGSI